MFKENLLPTIPIQNVSRGNKRKEKVIIYNAVTIVTQQSETNYTLVTLSDSTNSYKWSAHYTTG